MRVTVHADDAPCDAENSSRTDGWYAYVRGSDAIARQKDYAKGACWFSASATQGDARAQGMLAYLFYNGKGVDRDYQQAFQWAQKSAAEKNIFGENLLSTLYKEGKGVAPDPRKAAYWSRQAADQRNSQIWSRLDERSPSGFTPRQAIGLAISTFEALDQDSQRQAMGFLCGDSRATACWDK